MLDAASLQRELDRRSFLRLAGLAAAAGLLPTACREPLPPEVSLQALSPRGYATFDAATSRIVGPPGAHLVRTGQVQPALRADAWLAQLPDLAPLVSQALLVLEFGVYPLLGKLRPFTALDGPDQDAILDELMRSRFAWKRAVFGGVKSIACLSFYTDPAARTVTGYPGPFGNERVSIADAMTW
jgi:hypothetical protein